MTPTEFLAEVKAFGNRFDADFPERQTDAWFEDLAFMPIEDFREALGRIKRDMTSLPFKWNLVAEIHKAQVNVPNGKPQSFQQPVQDEAYWQNGLAKIREIKAKLAAKTQIPPEDFERRRRESLEKLGAVK